MATTDWKEQISPLQRLLLKASALIGFVIFFVGVQLTVRGRASEGGWLSAFGMFIAVQMRWGVEALYRWLERRRADWLARIGYRPLFWLLFFAAFVIDTFSLLGIFLFAVDLLPELLR